MIHWRRFSFGQNAWRIRLCTNGMGESHDITLKCGMARRLKAKKKDKTQPIFDAPDCDDLLNWLRHQPLLVYPNDHTVMVHAGIPPHWTISQAASYARELETQLQNWSMAARSFAAQFIQ